MTNIKNIFKTGAAIAVVSLIGFGCGERPESNPTDDVSTSQSIVAMDSSAANLSNPRPAPIGDTSVTAEQANRFGQMSPNQDTAARNAVRADMKRQLEENPNKVPKPSTPAKRQVTGQ